MKKGEERMHPLFRLLAAGTLLFGALFANFTAQAQPVCRATRSPDVMQAMFAPAGTPKSIIDLLQKEVAKAVAAADVKSKLDSLGFRRAHKGRSAEMGEGDRSGQDRKGEIN
jgi:hypothetical protein